MTAFNTPARKRLIEQVLSATTLGEIAAATQALDDWMDDHPGDFGLLDGYEQLANMQEIAGAQETERPAPALTGYAA